MYHPSVHLLYWLEKKCCFMPVRLCCFWTLDATTMMETVCPFVTRCQNFEIYIWFFIEMSGMSRHNSGSSVEIRCHFLFVHKCQSQEA